MTHPITPPPELVQKLWEKAEKEHEDSWDVHAAVSAARWGADQELEACCEWIRDYLHQPNTANALRENRRPKPPSLKEQALKMLAPINSPVMPGTPEYRLYEPQVDIIRRALESLPDTQD